jgi:hypothetical protein
MIIFGEQSLMPICRPPTRQFETSQYANVRMSEENNTRNNPMNASIMPVFNESKIDQFWRNNVTEVNGALAANSGSQKRPLHSIWHDGGGAAQSPAKRENLFMRGEYPHRILAEENVVKIPQHPTTSFFAHHFKDEWKTI